MFILRRLSKGRLIVKREAGTTLDTGGEVGQIEGVKIVSQIKICLSGKMPHPGTAAHQTVFTRFRCDEGGVPFPEIVIRHKASDCGLRRNTDSP